MTRAESKRIAESMKEHRPDPVSATIGERMLWGRMVRAMESTCANNTTGFRAAEWREAAGVPPEMD
jgi:hypothetical protein